MDSERFSLERVLGRSRRFDDPTAGFSALAGRVVLLTGAGGSIGSRLARRVLAAGPATALFVDSSEHRLHRLFLEMRDHAPRTAFLLVDLFDSSTLREIFGRYLPDVIVHAAAYKQVPLLESQPVAAIRNNVLGTWRLLRAAREFDSEKLLMVSTDKAVEPASWLGVSKRLAERLLAGHAGSPSSGSVRLGNVWGSVGSVVPLFLERIEAGRPIDVVAEEATRFFVDPEDAASIILAALEESKGGDVLIPDMGESVSILGLARRLVEMAGDPPGVTIRIGGLRPGDKLHERLRDDDEREEATSRAGITRLITPAPGPAAGWVEGLESAVASGDAAALVERVRKLLPGYVPTPTLLRAAGIDEGEPGVAT